MKSLFVRIRHRFSSALRYHWLTLKRDTGLPRASIRAALRRADSLADSSGPGRYMVVAEPRVYRLPVPRYGWDDDGARAAFTAAVTTENHGWVYATPPVTMARLKNARLVGPECGLITNDHHFIGHPQSFTGSRSLVFEPSGRRAYLLDSSKPRRLADKAVLLWDGWATNYYHWLLEFLPRFQVLEQFPELAGLPIILGRWSGFHAATLELLGIGRSQIILFPGGVGEVGQLYLPSPLCGQANGDEAAWLRAKLLPAALAGAAPAGRKRLYVSRADAPSRRVLNEAEVMAALAPLGFEKVCPGALPVAEQIRLFSQAEIVVGVHGAGLANAVFMPKGAALVELFASSYLNGCYWALAAAAGVEYGFLTGEAANRSHDFKVDAGRLALMASAIAKA